MQNTYDAATKKSTVLAPEEPYRYLARLESAHIENMRKQSCEQGLRAKIK